MGACALQYSSDVERQKLIELINAVVRSGWMKTHFRGSAVLIKACCLLAL